MTSTDPRFIDLTGKQYNRWLVLKHIEGQKWKCSCECGTIKIIKAPAAGVVAADVGTTLSRP